MALTKVKLIADGVINVDNLAASHGITTDNIGEGLSLYYTNERVGTYLTANNYATQSFVTTAVSNLVDAAPSTLDTLNELAAALGDDPNFATTVTNSIAGKLPLTGGTLTGNLSIGNTNDSYKLDVSGTGMFRGALTVRNDQGTGVDAQLRLRGTNSTARTTRLQFEDYNGTLADGIIDFKIPTAGVASSATLSIGINSPNLTFVSTGAATFSSSVTTGGLVTINKQNEGLILTAGANTDASYMSTRANNSTGWLIIGSQGSVANYIQTGTGANESAITTVGAYALSLGTNQTERLRITSGGNIGIGTTSPAVRFHAEEATTYIGRFAYNSNNYVAIRYDGFNVVGGSMVFEVASSEKMRIDSSGNIGIGTDSPNNLVHLQSTASTVSGTQLTLESRYEGYGAGIDFVSRTTNGGTRVSMAKITADAEDGWNPTVSTQDAGLRFFTTLNGSQSEKLRISSSGNVGIGTTNPTPHNGNNALIIKGNNDRGIMEIWNGTATGGKSILQNVEGNTYVGQLDKGSGSGNTYVLVNGNGTSADIGMTILSGGNVGIGVTSPGAKLDVVGLVGGDPILRLQRDSVGSYDYFITDGGAGSQQLYLRGNNNDSGFAFQTKNSAGGAVTAVFIEPEGKVGIGTTDPSDKLQVVGPASIINVKSTTAGANANVHFETTARRWGIGANIALSSSLFEIYDYTAGSNRLVLDNNGYVGIGTTSPGAKLDVAGGIKQSNPDQTFSRVQTVHGQTGNFSTVKVIFNKTNWGSVTYDIKVASAGGTYHTAGAYYSNPGFTNDLVSISTGNGISVSKIAENLTGGSQGATWIFSGATMVHPIVTVDIACGNGFQVTEESIIVQIT